MHPYESAPAEGRRHRRQHSAQFKAELIASCQQRGVSVAAVARTHDLHPNLLRKWIQEFERFGHHEPEPVTEVRCDVAAEFVPLRLASPPTVSPQEGPADIHIDLQRNGITASVRWPVTHAEHCAIWLRALACAPRGACG
ncbi:transposase [Pollutimonas bauzanensis]|uniref:transposase n=1 Tax=Pollutimonas bauzanensis TaxID=658167 RepID=UPI000A03CF99|nr:transposase [Pollutimonas bauzanensis]